MDAGQRRIGIGSCRGTHQWCAHRDSGQLLALAEAVERIGAHVLGVRGAGVEGVALNCLNIGQQIYERANLQQRKQREALCETRSISDSGKST